MREINFITMGDENYFPFIHISIKNLLKLYPFSKFFIYDWGFTLSQRKKIISYPNSIIIDWTEKIKRETGYLTVREDFVGKNPLISRKREYLMNQKPVCMLDCAKRIIENMVYIDGDAILINNIDEIFEYDFELGVTLRFREDLDHIKKNGIVAEINAGVIFFKMISDNIILFLNKWLKEIERTEISWMEQTALIKLIEEENEGIFNNPYNIGNINLNSKKIKVQLFPCSIYNFYKIEKGYNQKDVKILHFKRRTSITKIRKFKKEIKLQLLIHSVMKLYPKILGRKFNKEMVQIYLYDFIKASNKKKRILIFLNYIFKRKFYYYI